MQNIFQALPYTAKTLIKWKWANCKIFNKIMNLFKSVFLENEKPKANIWKLDRTLYFPELINKVSKLVSVSLSFLISQLANAIPSCKSDANILQSVFNFLIIYLDSIIFEIFFEIWSRLANMKEENIVKRSVYKIDRRAIILS